MKECVNVYGWQKFVVKDRETFLKTIRQDGRNEGCRENLEKIDFDRHTLLGLFFFSGYCRIPAGLVTETVKDAAKKQYVFTASYLEPQGVCRHMGGYGVWALVPKLPEGWKARLQVGIRFRRPSKE